MSQRKPLSDRFLEEVQNTMPTLKLPWNNAEKIPFWRLDDDEHFLLRRQSVAIEEDYGLLMRLNFEEVHVEEDAYEAAIDKWRRIVAALT